MAEIPCRIVRRRRFPLRGRRRCFLGEGNIYQVECNIDDMNPEIFPYLVEKLLIGGAKDAWLTPIVMKKGRAAVTLSFLVEEGKLEELTDLVGRESSTAGMRFFPVERKVFRREIIKVMSPWGEMELKRIEAPGGARLSPEFESCRKLAENSGEPLQRIMSWAAHYDWSADD